MVIVGLGGPKGVGKDTVAEHLVEMYGFKKVSLADPIKRLLNERFGWSMEDWQDREWKEEGQLFYGCKETHKLAYCPQDEFSPRSWAQWLGTEVGRTIAGQDVWCDMLFEDLRKAPEDSRFVISDCRFQNEVHYISDWGGFTIGLYDPAKPPSKSEHVSEEIDSAWFDYEVEARRGDLLETLLDVDRVLSLEGVSRLPLKVN